MNAYNVADGLAATLRPSTLVVTKSTVPVVDCSLMLFVPPVDVIEVNDEPHGNSPAAVAQCRTERRASGYVADDRTDVDAAGEDDAAGQPQPRHRLQRGVDVDARGGVERDARAGDPAAHYDEVEAVALHRGESVWPRDHGR